MRVAAGTKRAEFDPKRHVLLQDVAKMLRVPPKVVGPKLFKVNKARRFYDGKNIFFEITDVTKAVEDLHNNVRNSARNRLKARKAFTKLAALRAPTVPTVKTQPKPAPTITLTSDTPTSNMVRIEVPEEAILPLVRLRIQFRIL
jgi:hypothetical protein